MAFESAGLFWKQMLLSCYATITAVRGALMVLRPSAAIAFMRRTTKRVVEWCFGLMGRTMPRVKHEHQVVIVRVMGVMSLIGASMLIWWLVR